MFSKSEKMNVFISVLIVGTLLFGATFPAINADELKYITGFDKGPSYTSVVPLKKTIMVGFDEESYLDDYAYLSGIPASIFEDQGKLFSNPLIYYQDEYQYSEDKERTLNARPGIDYFMEDWMSYCNGQMDQFISINIPKDKINTEWEAENVVHIDEDNAYDIASALALQEWSYSNDVVIAPAEEKPEIEIERYTGETEGFIPAGYNVEYKELEIQKPEVGVGGSYKSFEVRAPAKYIVANLEWKNLLNDYDFQLYDDQLGMAAANSKWNIYYDSADRVPNEPLGTYIYNYGTWEAGVTFMPTQSSEPEGKMQSMYQNVDEGKGLFSKIQSILNKKSNMLPADIYLYPGVEIEIPEQIPYGCRDAEFTLKWHNPNMRLGFFILDPTGTESFSTPDADSIINGIESGKTELTIKLKAIGETIENEKYKVGVFTMDDASSEIDFSVEYSWQQNMTREEGDILASACEGAILASQLNAPLLYVKDDQVPKITENTLYKLGVKNIYFVNLNNCTKNSVRDHLKEIANLFEYSSYKKIYDAIRDKTGSNDVIFSTVDPWSYFYGGEPPAGENPGCLFIGPAAYIAAYHGSPLLLVDNHPTLSQTTVWHTQFWLETSTIPSRPILPTVSCMVLTGRRVIGFLEDLGYNLPLDKENLATMITVAGQYDIGFTWDRTFTGRLIPGRFCFSPVDTAYSISRSIFYPALIFQNPALKDTVTLETGSSSIIQPYIGKLRYPRGTDLVITKESMEEEFEYPLLHTYDVYQYKFNEIAPAAWGGKYTCANGIIPGETASNYRIDQGVVEGKVAAYYPDLDETFVTPIYAEKAGYSNCFSTNFDVTIENLNSGVIMWMESCHGHAGEYGGLSMWNPDSPYVYEDNPWRAYDRIFAGARNWYELGKYFSEGYATQFPASIAKIVGLLLKLVGFIPNLLLPDVGCTANPDAESTNPYIVGIPLVGGMLFDAFRSAPRQDIPFSRILSKIPILGRLFRVYGDGTVIDSSTAGMDVMKNYDGIDFDDNLDNLHSMGLVCTSCLAAGTYWQITMMRHGSSYIILDPWSTSWYSSLWFQNVPRQLALGDTIGQTYEKGMALVGAEYLIDHWWWDLNENVIFYGDPDIRVWTPENEYDAAGLNHWEREDIDPLSYNEEISINGHMPFGATSYPREREPQPFLPIWLLVVIALIVILLLVLAGISRKKK